MQGILNFFQGIGDAIVAVIDFVISFFADIVYLIQLLGKALASLPGYIDWLPPEMVTLLIVLIGVVVIYKILGREG
ncbi:MAG: hypothetical protein IJO56_06390 [Oscillospiraceae bacterium]|nr:hypothetical protein [Oscillospiraceae bacterium]